MDTLPAPGSFVCCKKVEIKLGKGNWRPFVANKNQRI